MSIFNLRKKTDPAITSLVLLNSKRRIPMVLCCRGNLKNVRNQIFRLSGTVKYEYVHINAIACELSPQNGDKLAALPEVTYAAYDHKATLCMRRAGEEMDIDRSFDLRLTGRKIGIGLVDTGVFPHQDLVAKRSCIRSFMDVLQGIELPYDDHGHGTFLSGCICSTGHYRGIAPDSNLYVAKAFDSVGRGFLSDILQGIDLLLALAEQESIKLLCLPFEFCEIEQTRLKPLMEMLAAANAKGLTVIAPAGNGGPKPYTIHCPGSLPAVLTVGGTEPMEGSIRNLHTSFFSGRGPTRSNVPKPDLCAPSCSIMSLNTNPDYLPGTSKFIKPDTSYRSCSGTSISCALVTGFAALILEKHPELTPVDLKSYLTLLTTSYGESKYAQGSGFITLSRLVE